MFYFKYYILRIFIKLFNYYFIVYTFFIFHRKIINMQVLLKQNCFSFHDYFLYISRNVFSKFVFR